MSTKALTGQQVADSGPDGWTFLLHYGLHGLQTQIHTKDFAAGLDIVQAIGQTAEELNHHAGLDLRKTRRQPSSTASTSTSTAGATSATRTKCTH